MRSLFILAFLISNYGISYSQSYFGSQFLCDHESCGLKGDYTDKYTYIPPPEGFEYGAERDATILVTYNGFPAAAQTAFQFAVDIWASFLDSDVPITITATWQNIGGGTLGFATANDFERNFFGAPQTNVWYPAALANKLAGVDLNPGTSDISCSFNSTTNWYFGVDGNTPGGQFDLVTVVLHELGHGLGSIGGSNFNAGTGTYGFSGVPVTYDVFVENQSGQDLASFGSPSTLLGSQLIGNALFWNGTQGVNGLNGERPRIYAPPTWNPGSSYSHLDEGTYSFGNPNSLMTPFVGFSEAIHDPGPAMLGMFQDMGWEIFPECNITDVSIANSTQCVVSTGNFDLTLSISYENPPTSGFLLVNGTPYNITSSPQEIMLTLPANSEQLSFTVLFSESQSCNFQTGTLLTAPPPCCSMLRFTEMDPVNQQFTIQNFGTCIEDLSTYRLSTEGNFFLFNGLTPSTGSFDIDPGSSITFQWDTWNPSASGSNVGLFVPFADFNNPLDMRDFVQWGVVTNGGENEAEAAGFWTIGDAIPDGSPYTFTGGSLDYGVNFWNGVALPNVCSIDNVSLGEGTGCNASSLTYSQELIVTYTGEPSSGSINVNEQLFSITSSPQTITLTGLVSDGLPVSVFAVFSEDSACTSSSSNLFVAPESCACKFDFNGNGLVAIEDLVLLLEDFGCTTNCSRDLSGDSAITTSDLAIFLQNFGNLCVP